MSRKRVRKSSIPRGGQPITQAPPQPARLPEVHRDAAGVDVGATVHFVAIPGRTGEVAVRSFGTYTADLVSLADWLERCGVKRVAMESTGVYWIPLYELLERRGFEVLLAEPSQLKKVPGRKSDVLDCQWIQQLHSYGLLRASFRPADEIVVLRGYLRQREMLVRFAAAHVQHIQKALEQMNVKLSEVLDDLTGRTGMSIIQAILEGQRDPAELASLRDPRCHHDEETIALALQGNWREEHLFALRQAVELHDIYQQKITELDDQLETYLQSLPDRSAGVPRTQPTPRRKKRGKHEPHFDVLGLLHRVTGAELPTIPGIGPHAALQLIGEIGLDLSRWPTVKHFCSWLCLCPGVNKSGGSVRSRSGKTRPSGNRAAKVLRLCAQSLLRMNSALGAFGRRIRARLGGPKAVTAVAHKLAQIVYGMLRYGRPYTEPGAAQYEQRQRDRIVHQLRERAGKLGYTLNPQPIST